MILSILHFRVRSPRLLSVLVMLTAILSLVFGAAYSVWWNPEVQFYVHGDEIKRTYLEDIHAAHDTKTVVFGGSSCTTSIRGEQLVEKGMPVVNLGLGAGMGAEVLARYAFQYVRPGDRVVVSLEPDLLVGSPEIPSMGHQFAWASGRRELVTGGGWGSFVKSSLQLRPGGPHVFTMLGKVLLGRPLYRYNKSDFSVSGWREVHARRNFQGVVLVDVVPNPEVMSLLVELSVRQLVSHERMVYAFPFSYVEPERMELMRSNRIQLALGVGKTMPVLKDVTFGLTTNRSLFADTPYHPTGEGARLRTEQFGELLRKWEVWGSDDLEKLDPSAN